jgi:hypothetical protein
MGSWIFPDLKEFPGGNELRNKLGFEREQVALAPIPIKPLLPTSRMVSGDEPLGGSLPVLRAWFEATNVARAAIRGDEDANIRARALQQFFSSFPVTAQGLQPAWNQMGLQLGLEPDVDFREGIFEEVIAAMLQMREPDMGSEEELRRSQALPKIPSEEERFVVPLERPQVGGVQWQGAWRVMATVGST